jgi:RNA polymerase sigma factor (TIGR02999 family)
MSADLSLASQVTTLLETAARGDSGVEHHAIVDQLVPLVYDELHAIAHQALEREHGNRTLQTTALVHEAYLKLAGDANVTARGRAYFFAAAARAMRQVLVARARRRNAAKRGGGADVVTLGEIGAGDRFAMELVDLDDALRKLARRNSRQVKVVEHRFFAGLSVKETAEVLGVSTRTVESDWAMARAWLFHALCEEPPAGTGGPPG